jgi:hypothetical protein
VVEYLIREKRFTIEQLVSAPPHFEEVKKETQDWIRMSTSEDKGDVE